MQSAHRQDPGHQAVGDVLQTLQNERRLQRALVAVQLSPHLLLHTAKCFIQNNFDCTSHSGASMYFEQVCGQQSSRMLSRLHCLNQAGHDARREDIPPLRPLPTRR